MSSGPPLPSWTFQEAREESEAAEAAQAETESGYVERCVEAAEAERTYRIALAQKILALRADGSPATVAADLARGDASIAHLRYLRDVAEGAREAAKAALYHRHAANRRDVEALIRWSNRQEDRT